MKEKYLDECRIIQQNCNYTAETHHIIALSAKRKAFWLEVIPSVIAAITSALVTADVVGLWLLPFTIVSASISAITAILNPNKTYQDHIAAARNFAVIKHDARFLCESQSTKMKDDVLYIAIENLHLRYNELLKSVPPTDQKSFEKAQKRIKAGVHEPDRDTNGKIS
jgi:hypothetical protein